MRIGVFLQDVSPESGGAFTFAETVISGLVSSGIPDEIVVFHYGRAGKLKTRLNGQATFRCLARTTSGGFLKRAYYATFSPLRRRIAVRLASSFGFSRSYPPASPLGQAAKRAGIDILWFPTPGSEAVECPYIFTVWDLEHRISPYFPEVSAGGEWDARERYFATALKRASYIITGTEVGKREICQFYGVDPKRIRLLPHPTPSFALTATETLALPDRLGIRKPYVVYPAQFWAHKNHVGLLEAIAVLRDQGSEVHVALVGSDKGNRKYVEQFVQKLKLEKQVHFLGFVAREDLVALYQNALALVYPSLCGPENLPPLEAMALGCPVIAHHIEGAKEQLRDAAVLVDATNDRAFAAAIQKLLTSPTERAELIGKGKSRATEYSEKEFVKELGKTIDDFRNLRKLWDR